MRIQAYKILWWTIPLIFLPIALGRDSALDIQRHDTYFIFAAWHVAILFTLILGILGGFYWMLKQYKLSQILSIIHSVGTSLSLLGISIIAILQTLYRNNNFEQFGNLLSIGAILIMVFLSIQIIFIANVLIGLIRGKKLNVC